MGSASKDMFKKQYLKPIISVVFILLTSHVHCAEEQFLLRVLSCILDSTYFYNEKMSWNRNFGCTLSTPTLHASLIAMKCDQVQYGYRLNSGIKIDLALLYKKSNYLWCSRTYIAKWSRHFFLCSLLQERLWVRFWATI